MLNRQLTMGNSKDNMMVEEAHRTFATDSRAKSRITFSQDKDDLRNTHRTFATETTRKKYTRYEIYRKKRNGKQEEN